MNKYFMLIHYERLHNHNNAKHNKTVYIFLGIYCIYMEVHKGLSSDTSAMAALATFVALEWHGTLCTQNIASTELEGIFIYRFIMLIY